MKKIHKNIESDIFAILGNLAAGSSEVEKQLVENNILKLYKLNMHQN